MSSELCFPLASPLTPGRLGGAVLSPGSARGLRPGLSLASRLASHRSGQVSSRAVSPRLGICGLQVQRSRRCSQEPGGRGQNWKGLWLWSTSLYRRARGPERNPLVVRLSVSGAPSPSPVLPVWCCFLSVLVGVTRFAPLRFEMRKAGPQGAAAGVGAKLVPVRCPPGLLRSQPPCCFHCIWKPRRVTGSIHAHVAQLGPATD